MESRVLLAAQKHKSGYNCCQAVLCTYIDLLEIDEKTAFRVSEGFGLGIAGTYGTCGAVCAMVLACSLKTSDGNLEKPKSKLTTYELSRQMIQRFEQMHSTSLCRDLKGLKTKKCIRSCRGCVMDCAKIIEEMLFPQEFDPYTGPSEYL